MLEDLKRVFHANIGKIIDDSTAHVILSAIASVRDLRRVLQTYPRHLFQTLFENGNYYGKCYYPCDIIELRDILKSGKIRSKKRIVLFSNQAWKKTIQTKKAILILKIDPTKTDALLAGGISILPRNELDVATNIVGIIVQRRAPFEQVERIISQTLPSCPVYDLSYIDGVDNEKFAKTNQKAFVVNLPQVQIHNQTIRANSPIEALEIALIRRWSWYHDKAKFKKRPDRFRADYWWHSPFRDSLVWEDGHKPKLLTAQKDTPMTNPQIQLTPQEQQIFSVLMDINTKMGLGITFRVAGGWVRDKILGVESDDIDVALDKMTGQQFVAKAFEYKASNPQAPLGKTYVVDQNVEKSKHLETTALEIAGLKIDFVNLRDESYGDSRIPTMKLSDDPKVDAFRRDLTINALFYNINTGQVEDYVGGIQDLQAKVLRTPLDAVKTFMDDPLRALRVLRFNSKLEGFNIAPEIVEALKRPEVQSAYMNKVSPERAGPEILKLFAGKKPSIALRVLYESGFDKAIFNTPDFQKLHPFAMDQRNPHHKLTVQDHTFAVMDAYAQILDAKIQSGEVSPKDRNLALIASWFHDYGKLHPEIGKPKAPNPKKPETDNPAHYTYIGHEDVSGDLAESFLKRIGVAEDDRKFVGVIVREHMTPHAHTDSWNKRTMGKFREKTLIPGQDRSDIWKFVMWHAKADDAGKGTEPDPTTQSQYDTRYADYEGYISAPPPMKPLIDGRELISMFPELDPKSGFINWINAQLKDKQAVSDKNQPPSLENVTDQDSARAFVNSVAAQVRQMFTGKNKPVRPSQATGDTMANSKNWFKRQKTADASSSEGPEGFVGVDETHLGREEGITTMPYYKPGQISAYRNGDRVRSKDGHYGRVKKVMPDNTVSVQWENTGKTEKYDLSSEAPALFFKV